jgi:CubicO group peptidase (beta-lactamase class C family)
MTRAVTGLLIGSSIQSGGSESGLHALDAYVPAVNTTSEVPVQAVPTSARNWTTPIDHPADLLEARVWHAFGMESDATWLTSEPEGTTSGCCLSATLRDFARLGVLAARDGQLPDGTRLVPEGWIAASLHLPDGQVGKGFLSLPGHATLHEHLEIANPQIFVDPDAEFVIALHANPPSGASDYAEHLHAVILALHEAVH